jgi:hypothetical protein
VTFCDIFVGDRFDVGGASALRRDVISFETGIRNRIKCLRQSTYLS